MGPFHVLFAFWFFGQIILVTSFFVRRIGLKPVMPKSATLLVLGDIGRSPRMMYHAKSLASHEYKTKLVGYTDTPPIAALTDNPLVELNGIANPPRLFMLLPWIFRAPIRILWQVLSVLKIVVWDVEEHSEVLIVQNPPSIPTLALAKVIAWFTGTRIIIDWHNTGYSILAMRVGEGSPLCSIAKWWAMTYDSSGVGSRAGLKPDSADMLLPIFLSPKRSKISLSANGSSSKLPSAMLFYTDNSGENLLYCTTALQRISSAQPQLLNTTCSHAFFRL